MAAPRLHGLSEKPIYNVWHGMHRRCYDKKDQDYRTYGGRGVSVCARWFDLLNFANDVGERPTGMTIDRIDSDGHYMPSNIRWVDRRQQSLNRNVRSDNICRTKGVYQVSPTRFRARIGTNGGKHLGYFKTLEEASRAYNEAALELYGEFAKLNPT